MNKRDTERLKRIMWRLDSEDRLLLQEALAEQKQHAKLLEDQLFEARNSVLNEGMAADRLRQQLEEAQRVLRFIRSQAEPWSHTGDTASLRQAMAWFVQEIDRLQKEGQA